MRLLVGILCGVLVCIGASAEAATITIGETTVLPQAGSGIAGLIVANPVTLSQPATAVSMSFYVGGGAFGGIRLGLYDATGPSGGPGVKKAETAAITARLGWNTATTASVSLPVGNYWLVFTVSSQNLSIRATAASGTTRYAVRAYGVLPGTFPVNNTMATGRVSMYATVNTTAPPPPPPPPVTWQLTIAAVGQGSTQPPVGVSTHPNGAVVALSGIPASGWTGPVWSGAGCGPTSVTMSQNRSCTGTFTVVQQPGRMTLDWLQGTGCPTCEQETGFSVERSPNSAPRVWSVIAQVGADVVTYVDMNRTVGETLCYRVRAVGPSGGSAYSNEACAAVAAP